jgi:hypothetical protein
LLWQESCNPHKILDLKNFNSDYRTICNFANLSPFFENTYYSSRGGRKKKVFVLVTAAIMENKDAKETVNKSTMGLLIVEGGFEDQVSPPLHASSFLQFCIFWGEKKFEANSRFRG